MSKFHLVLCLASLVSLTGCPDADPTPIDASLMRDAAVEDGGGFLDAGTLDASPPARDAGPAADAGAPLCDVMECDPREPAVGCSTGACVLWSDDPACSSEMPGRLSAGMPCAEVGECGGGLACFLVDGAGVCAPVCCPTEDTACAVGSRCGGSGVLVDGTETGWGRCVAQVSCELLAAETGCEPREACYLVDTTMMTECRLAGTAGAGESCAVQEDCQPGFFCGGIAAARRCVRLCRIAAGDCPTAEGRCIAQSHTPADIGLCTMDMTTFNR